MGDDDAIGVLCEVLADARAGDHVRSYAAMALQDYTDGRIGPALRKAVKEMWPGGEAHDIVIRELGRVRYVPAEPDLLAILRDPREEVSRRAAAQALAILRCQKAIPDLREIVRRCPVKQGEAPDADGYELSLLRLTGDWGRPGKDSRYMIWLPQETTAGQPIKATVYTENIAGRAVKWTDQGLGREGLMVNGKPLVEPTESRLWDGSIISWRASSGAIRSDTVDLSLDLNKPGLFRVRYGVGEVHSNEAAILIRPARP